MATDVSIGSPVATCVHTHVLLLHLLTDPPVPRPRFIPHVCDDW